MLTSNFYLKFFLPFDIFCEFHACLKFLCTLLVLFPLPNISFFFILLYSVRFFLSSLLFFYSLSSCTFLGSYLFYVSSIIIDPREEGKVILSLFFLCSSYTFSSWLYISPFLCSTSISRPAIYFSLFPFPSVKKRWHINLFLVLISASVPFGLIFSHYYSLFKFIY